AAGNAARVSGERALREFCDTKRVPVRFRADGDKTPFSDLVDGARDWSNRSANGFYNDVLDHLKMYIEVLLNRLSHGSSTTLERHDVQGAIVAIDALLITLKVVSRYE
ncbi:MAG: hypothetical protein Q8S53_13475, partial [Brevundimonas sp.]|uniref:hypothetical protein n=1 Tax=Brevundimonas sp. TaxID=1871086 RepID=UPI0027325AED